MAILTFQDVEKALPFGFWLRKKPVLRGVSLSVEEGEIYGFLGPNGAGKTTSIKCLLGLLQPDSGSVSLFGEAGPTLAARRRIGYLPEQSYFYQHLKGLELLEYFGRLFGMRGAVLRSKAEEMLDLVGLANDGDKPLGQYSKGMLQRIGVAQALINDPDLVIFDEPMSGLDPIGRRHVKDLIMAVKERGATVFFSSHILSDAEALCDRVCLLVDGKLRIEATLDDLLDTKADYWEAASEGLSADALPGLTPVAVQGDINFYRIFEESELDGWVDSVRGAGGTVYRVTPHRSTLEDYFVATVQEARGMIEAAYSIAVNTFKEAVRDRILAVFFLFAVLLMAASTVLSWLTVGSELKIVTDFGLAAEAFFAVVIAIFVGINLVYKEVDKRTIYAVLAKPVPRWLFLIGKYLGLMAVLVLAIALMSMFYLALVWWKGGVFPAHLIGALALSVLEVSVVTSVAIVFSAFAPPIEAAIFTAGVWAIGHMSSGFAALAARLPGEGVGDAVSLLYYVVPNLEVFNIRSQVVNELTVVPAYYANAFLYALGYTAAMLTVAVLIFRRRDLK